MPALDVPPGIEGVVRLTELPDEGWIDRWERIVLPEGIKDRLLNYLLFALRNRGRVSAVGLPIHGLLVLAGLPGTGKTTLAGGLADQAARALGERLQYAEIDPHAFPSQMLGESQRTVARLFERTLPDLARRGLATVVLLDEVESLAVSRTGASLETNPVDVHRATDAVLAGVDHVARSSPNLVFVATTNHISGVDSAFLSRADVIEEVGLPGIDAADAILRDTLAELLDTAALNQDGAGVRSLAASCVEREMDARQIRKLVLRAVTARRETAIDPSRLRLSDVVATLRTEAPVPLRAL